MAREISSKNIEGITDLVVMAPIREGFIDAYENITYETRLHLVAEALNSIRVSAREYEDRVPFSDTTERILTLLDFRVGIVDKDLFQLNPERGLEARRYLFLAATFDGAWEPYMRLIWRPLGDFLDLLFCNCEGYKPASDHSFAEYASWVRSAQVDSAIFYATTGLTVRDQLYLREFERRQRELPPADADLAIARLTMPNPEDQALADFNADPLDAHRMALEALTVLYRLADYYPPDRINPAGPKAYIPESGDAFAARNYTFAEGRYLLRAAQSLLKGWDPTQLPAPVAQAFADRLAWFETKAGLESATPQVEDPVFDRTQVQAGILTSPGLPDRPVRHGALLLMTVGDGTCAAKSARDFIGDLVRRTSDGKRPEGGISFEGDAPPENGIYRTIAFTFRGLKRLGLYDRNSSRFPKEFNEGMEKRAGLLGDFHANHPRNWTLPARNWPDPGTTAPGLPRPPVELSEVDFVIQLRYAPPDGPDDTALHEEVARMAELAGASKIELAAVEWMESYPDTAGASATLPGGVFGHFGFRDGISQPVARWDGDGNILTSDDVALGEIIRGYHNDRGDCASSQSPRPSDLQFNGSFLVIRKLGQDVAQFNDFLVSGSKEISEQLGRDFSAEELAARLMGRNRDGTPLISPSGTNFNQFTYDGDAEGNQCPFASHIRRANPRKPFLGVPAPRIARRGMSFGKQVDPKVEEDKDAQPRGVMFMAYCASIAEQYEVIQRWINGGNSTGVSSAQNDPILGVRPPHGDYVYRFVVSDKEHGDKVVRCTVPSFVKLHWGIYLFAPSRDVINYISGFAGPVAEIDKPLETRGLQLLEHLAELPTHVRDAEWKRALEDLDTKDPSERDLSPDIWSAIRYYEGGSYRIPPSGVPDQPSPRTAAAGATAPSPLDIDTPSTVLVGSIPHINEVLSTPEVFSVEEQGRRIHDTSGDIYVAMQPGARYDVESTATNAIMFAQSEAWGFEYGYKAAQTVLGRSIALATELKQKSFKIELRRDFLMPALGLICREWFGLPDTVEGPPPADALMVMHGWTWDASPDRKPCCPGDFLSPSRHAFYPKPTDAVAAYASDHGPRIRKAGLAFVKKYAPGGMPGYLSKLMASQIKDPDVLARNIIGMMIGALPPVDGNLRGILYEWITEATLWKHQAALRRASGDKAATYETANAALRGPISRAICKRPAPDLLYRTALADYVLRACGDRGAKDVLIRKGDLVILGLVSAAQWSLQDNSQDKIQDKKCPDGDVSIAFGGDRKAPRQPPGEPVHACPAQKMMMGTMMGILAGLLDVGRIVAMPASLIIQVSDWKQG